MSTTAEKLRIKAGDAMHVVGAGGRGLQVLGTLPVDAHVAAPGERVDVVIVFAANAAELRESLPAAAARVPEDGLIWVAYPKRGAGVATDLSRDGMTALTGEIAGVTGVTLVSVDATWSAMRLRPSARYRESG